MYQAFEEREERRRVELAKKALDICPDCADAYVILGENANDRREALELYEKGVRAGERALGSKAIQDATGHFWGIFKTRPYMRARFGLANALWTAGRREEAVQNLQEMLRLNPNDNQGVRYTLAGFLLSMDRDEDLARLLQKYPDEGSALWTYTKALLAFRQEGDTPEARRLLQEAKKANQHVPAILLGQKPLPQAQPAHYSPGQENEAFVYAGIFLSSWKTTPGAVSWVRQTEKITQNQEQQPQPKGPLGFIKSWVQRRIPQTNDIWQADFRRVPDWIIIAGEKVRPWIVLVTSLTEDIVLAHAIVEEPPSANHLWDTVLQALQKPVAGKPHRPVELRVRQEERWTSLKAHMEEIGVNLVLADNLDQMDQVFADMHEHLLGMPRPGLLDMPGVSPEQVSAFFDAAAGFYQHAPWKVVGDDATIKVECDKYKSGPWYAVVMGQAGMTLGLALYEDLRIVRKTQQGGLSDEDHARNAVVLTMTFGEYTDMVVKNLEPVQRYGWKLAGPEAYPGIFKKERGMSVRPPLSWELELMEGCLRSIPDFVNRYQQDNPKKEEIKLPVANGELKLRLSWVVEGM
ncbi:MAG TPA: hypothetical protein VGY77_12160 [Gemmataceae bacterium]|nr:hypothetical protein [Gemmataceae bacterium]